MQPSEHTGRRCPERSLGPNRMKPLPNLPLTPIQNNPQSIPTSNSQLSVALPGQHTALQPKPWGATSSTRATKRLTETRVAAIGPSGALQGAEHQRPTPAPAIPARSNRRATAERDYYCPPQQRGLPIRKSDCKACGLAITDKMMVSVDGRLTGKYHRACLLCAECKEPFSTPEVYVSQDKPYCAHHYHELNDSLCKTCPAGIEGRYVGVGGHKYHVGCVRCSQCKNTIVTWYWEIDGQPVCYRCKQEQK